jgi:KOW motif
MQCTTVVIGTRGFEYLHSRAATRIILAAGAATLVITCFLHTSLPASMSLCSFAIATIHSELSSPSMTTQISCSIIPSLRSTSTAVSDCVRVVCVAVLSIKPGKVVIVLAGRYAGRKAVVVKAFDEGTNEHKFPHALVAGIERYPLRVPHSNNTLTRQTSHLSFPPLLILSDAVSVLVSCPCCRCRPLWVRRRF